MCKEKIQTSIAQQRINLADVDYFDLDSVEKIIHDFENFKKNPRRNSENSQKNVLEPVWLALKTGPLDKVSIPLQFDPSMLQEWIAMLQKYKQVTLLFS